MKNRFLLAAVLVCLAIPQSFVLGQSDEKAKPPQVEQKDKTKKGTAKDPKQLAKEKDIRRLLVATGAGKMGVQAMTQMFASLKAQNPSIPSSYFEKLMAEVDPNELIEITIPSYDKHLTHEEIKELIKFYESPIGKKMIEKQPMIMQDAMVAGQKWGVELNRRMREKIEEDF